MVIQSTLKLKLIYVFRINDASHLGCLKVGEATASDDEDLWGLAPNSAALNRAAKKRINQYTQTAGIAYDLLHTELSVFTKSSRLCGLNDNEVHNVLLRSGIKKKSFDTENKANEWFIADLETIKKAITAAKEGKNSLSSSQISTNQNPIVFRPEQREAINKTKKQFKKSDQFLWNAKMRFGKTLSAMQVVKEMAFKRTLILTHRPVVDAGWFDDFGKIFHDSPQYIYGSKNKGDKFEVAEKQAQLHDKSYLYFASVQDLRGSELVGGKFDKNDQIFAAPWELIIVDEAHEGMNTDLGKAVVAELTKDTTKILRLSGTPFNLLDDYKEDEIYTWDYVMEQQAKQLWNETRFGDPNPYAGLPRLNIFTYNIGKLYAKYADSELAFNFREFFRTNNQEEFLHKADVNSFLNLISRTDSESQYPYSTTAFRDNFRHTLWCVPGVKEARALSSLLKQHSVFQHFNIVNVAGDGDEEEDSADALKAVETAMGTTPENTYTITLSCGRLTTGVSVKPWTAVLMLSGSLNTAASTYMQTIFRVQTPATIGGKVKEECYVFDFAPDRTLKVIAETAKISAKAGKTSGTDRQIMGEFLNFCPIIAIDGSRMQEYDTNRMLEQLKRVYVERVVKNGFEDNNLYSEELMRLDDLELKEFADLKKIVGATKAMPKSGDIDLNQQGFTQEEHEQLEQAEKKQRKKQELTEEEKELLAKKTEKKKNRDSAISILRGISIRMPLLIYGAELNDETQDITIDNFSALIDPQSWEEFMPKGVSKQLFNSFKKYYDPDIFCAAGKRIRAMARAADTLTVEERIERIATIFSTFRNPDKETVLTPWRVVNMHLSDCMGGYEFYDEARENTIPQPRFVDQGTVTSDVFSADTRILEINSKSGLYPLYMAYSVYRNRLSELPPHEQLTLQGQQQVWDSVLQENIFVLCKTPMAKQITKRTLAGFRDVKVNTRSFDDLINQITNKSDKFLAKVRNGKTCWNANNDTQMKFKAIVGNPPYQIMDGGAQASSKPIYNYFVEISKQLKPSYLSMIMPSRWYAGGKGLDDFRDNMLNDKRISVLHDYLNPEQVFPNTNIRGGLCYFLWDKSYNNEESLTKVITHQANLAPTTVSRLLKTECSDTFIRHGIAVEIIDKVSKSTDFTTFSDYVSVLRPFGFRGYFINDERFRPTNQAMHSPVICYGKGRKIGYVERGIITIRIEWIDKYKVYTPRANNIGTELNDDNLNSFVGEPNTICTESYIVLGANLNLNVNSAECLCKYLRTKFTRFQHSLAKASQDATSKTYQFVPLQDFTPQSDIDWSKSVSEIDQQLYAKYGLTAEEVNFIESMIKPME
ncbi:MAG: Eco57I restriction-modification methylase domain-containing protein [Bacteroidales bacterium]